MRGRRLTALGATAKGRGRRRLTNQGALSGSGGTRDHAVQIADVVQQLAERRVRFNAAGLDRKQVLVVNDPRFCGCYLV